MATLVYDITDRLYSQQNNMATHHYQQCTMKVTKQAETDRQKNSRQQTKVALAVAYDSTPYSKQGCMATQAWLEDTFPTKYIIQGPGVIGLGEVAGHNLLESQQDKDSHPMQWWQIRWSELQEEAELWMEYDSHILTVSVHHMGTPPPPRGGGAGCMRHEEQWISSFISHRLQPPVSNLCFTVALSTELVMSLKHSVPQCIYSIISAASISASQENLNSGPHAAAALNQFSC